MQTKKKIDTKVVFIDYFQMINIRNGNNSSYEKLSYIAQKLKHLSVKYKICIILLVQLNRSQERLIASIPGFNNATVEEKLDALEPSLSDLKGTSDLEQIAETVTFIVRHNSLESHTKLDTESEKSISQKNKDTMKLIVKKNRHGRCGSISCSINLENLTIKEESRGLTEEQKRQQEFEKIHTSTSTYTAGGLLLDSRVEEEFNRVAYIVKEIRNCDNKKAPLFITNNHISTIEMALKDIVVKNISRIEHHLNVARFDSQREGEEYKVPLWYLMHPGSPLDDRGFSNLNTTPKKIKYESPSYRDKKTIHEIVKMRNKEKEKSTKTKKLKLKKVVKNLDKVEDKSVDKKVLVEKEQKPTKSNVKKTTKKKIEDTIVKEKEEKKNSKK